VRLYLVRHASVDVRPEQPGPQWHLSAQGRADAEALAASQYWQDLRMLSTSPEPKAVGTAQRIAAPHGLPIRIAPDLREVGGRAWAGSADAYREQVQRYLQGEAIDSWEPKDGAQRRVRACIDGILADDRRSDVAVVSHGLILTLYLDDLLKLDGTAAYELWSAMRLPDVAVADPKAGALVQRFGERTG
jgi:broad specificity phosphatase PhoE